MFLYLKKYNKENLTNTKMLLQMYQVYMFLYFNQDLPSLTSGSSRKSDTPSPQASCAPTQLVPAVAADPATHSNQDLPSLASGSSSRKSDTPSPSAKLRAHSTHPRRRRASPRTPPPIHTQCAVAIILHPAPAPTTRHTHTGRDTISSSRREQ